MIEDPVVIVGMGRSGRAAAEALRARGHRVVTFDQSPRATQADQVIEDAAELARAVVAARPRLAVVSPGVSPREPAFAALARAGVPVWGELELAWRLQESGSHAGRPWLAVTGTNGKTTTVGMLGSILRAGGEDADVVGNVGTPITGRVDSSAQVFAVEMSSFQLATAESVRPEAAVCLNVDADHVDWHGSVEAYRAAKARVYRGVRRVRLYPVADAAVAAMVRQADPGPRAVGLAADAPAAGQVGVEGEALVDRAFPHARAEGRTLATFADLEHIAGGRPSPAVVADAVAAAGLALAHGADAAAIAPGLRAFQPAAHRRHVFSHAAGLTWIDDSKATNAHAAEASLAPIAPGTAVWIFGGDAKGQVFDDLVERVAPTLRAVVLIGADRAPLREALRGRAPSVPVREVEGEGPWMDRVASEALALARPGDTVDMAPACASWDQFDDYGQRGDAFQRAVARVTDGTERPA